MRTNSLKKLVIKDSLLCFFSNFPEHKRAVCHRKTIKEGNKLKPFCACAPTLRYKMSLQSRRGSLSETHLTDGAEIRPSTVTHGETELKSRSPRGKPGQSLGHQAGSAAVRGEDFSTTVAFDCTLHKEPPLDRLNYGPRRGED